MLSNINKEGLLKNKTLKGDVGRLATKLLKVVSLLKENLILLLSSLARPY